MSEPTPEIPTFIIITVNREDSSCMFQILPYSDASWFLFFTLSSLSGPIGELIAQPFAPWTPSSAAPSTANIVINCTCSHVHYHKVITSLLFSEFHPETPRESALNHEAAIVPGVPRRVAPRSSLLLAVMNKAVELYSSLWNT